VNVINVRENYNIGREIRNFGIWIHVSGISKLLIKYQTSIQFRQLRRYINADGHVMLILSVNLNGVTWMLRHIGNTLSM